MSGARPAIRLRLLDIGGHYPNNAFTAVILRDDASKFPDVHSLEDKTVDVTGTIKLYTQSNFRQTK